MKIKSLLTLGLIIVHFAFCLSVRAQGSSLNSFTYQGRLNDTNGTANGLYDFSFALFSTGTGGSQVGTTVSRGLVPVTNGLFTVPLEFPDANSFSGADRWLEIAVHPSGVGTNITLSPRQQITAAPYAIRAANLSGTLPLAQLPAGVVMNGGSGVTLAGTFIGNGAGLSNVNAATLGGLSSAGFWKTNGNAGASPTNGAFLGTTDNLPLEIRVNGQQAFRLEPGTNFTISVIGGVVSNRVINGAIGATIGGGGTLIAGDGNIVGGNLGTVGGGRQNSALVAESTVAGGRANTASAFNATVSGGYANGASGDYATVAGGFGNTGRGRAAALGGGEINTIELADYATIGGGSQNKIQTNAHTTTIGGGANNTITSNALRGTVGGGFANTVGAPEGTVAGGAFNNALGFSATIGGGGGNTASGEWSTIAGGRDNLLTNADYAIIGGGLQNKIQLNAFAATIGGGSGNAASGGWSTIAGGRDNVLTNADYAAIGGGVQNIIQTNAAYSTIGGGAVNVVRSNAYRGTVGGGFVNTVGAPEGTVAGGAFNSALGFSATIGGGGGNAASGDWSIIGGGRDNQLLNAPYATIGGGLQNTIQANGFAATIPGGWLNSATTYGFAGGRRAKANHTGAFVWADSTDADFTSTGNNQFLIRAVGGVGINNNNPNGAALAVNGTVTATSFQGDGTFLTGVAMRDFGNQFTGDQSISGNLTVSGSVAIGSAASAGFAAAAIGFDAQASGNYSTAIGEHTRATANYGMALGFGSQADHMGSFVWADATVTGFASTANNQFLIRAGGGVGINKNNPATALDVNGTITASSFSGSGAGLTSHNAANLSGSIADARLSANVALRGGGNAFTGNQTISGGNVGIGTVNPQGSLHVYSANNPTIMRLQSSGTPGFGRLEFVSNPQGDVNEWRPGYIQSTDNGGFSGGLSFVVNGTGAGNKFGEVETMRIVNGRVGIGTPTPVSALQVIGTVTATAFNPPSDRNLKENFTTVSAREVLKKVTELPISRWNFKGDAATPHVGPMAQDFHAAFGLGTDDKHIATVDADGVALAAIQGLNQKLEEVVQQKDAELQALKQTVAELKAAFDQLGRNPLSNTATR